MSSHHESADREPDDPTADAVDLGPDRVSPVPDPHPRRPRLSLPAGAWDMHCHVVGPRARFPLAEGVEAPDAGVESLAALHRVLGLEHALIVQTVAHGADHGPLLDALATGEGRYRGVALLGPEMGADDLDRLDEAGVRGLRLNFLPHLGGTPQRSVLDAAVDAVRRRAGWHLEVHVAGSGILDNLDLLAGLDVPVVLDHLARVDLASPEAGRRLDAVEHLLGLGHVWLKVSGVDRLSEQPPPFEDAVEVATRFVAAAPDRTLWGTDFPHPNSSGWLPSDATRVEQLARVAPGEAGLERLLVRNPLALLGEA